MNNPNPFLPQSSFFQEQKNRARARLKIAVYFSISLSVMALMALLIQGCRKPNDVADNGGVDTNNTPQLPTNPPDMAAGSNTAMTPPPTETNPPAPVPVPVTPPPPPPPVVATPVGEDYTVVKGDTLAAIAKNNHVSLRALEDANPGVDAKRLKIGEKLHLPAASSTSATPMNNGAADEAAAGGEQTYKVKSGDTLTSIARRFHVSIKALESANHLGTTSIKVGKVLKIPATAAAAPAPAPTETAPPPPVPAPVAPAPAPATPPAQQ
ncbi:MAG TPA: LysM peptidoglycan-binding domain-containing protein [Candidatus Angelobacter sp.]|nr:LysM peptidoglycan-binding domain-containing protein [Candidatus Angelobacter sp.]